MFQSDGQSQNSPLFKSEDIYIYTFISLYVINDNMNITTCSVCMSNIIQKQRLMH